MGNEQRESIFTLKRILQILSLVCFVIVFCPVFFVSCSGETMNVSVLTAVSGGERLVEPHPEMLICAIIPIAIFSLLIAKNIVDKKKAAVIAVCAAVDIIIWFVFKTTVAKIAEENYCSFEITGWYVLNHISLFLIVMLSAIVIIGKIQMNSDLIFLLSGKQGRLKQMSATVKQVSNVASQMTGNITANISNMNKEKTAIGFCSKCGSPIEYGDSFCASCGTAVPQSIIDEVETSTREEEENGK